MQYRLVAVAVVGFWAVMMASLVRRWLLEVKPELIPGTYRSVLTRERENYYCKMGIYLAGGEKRVGHTETAFHYTDDGKHRLTNTTRLEMPATGLLSKLAAFGTDTVVVVGKDYTLERFSVAVSSAVLNAQCDGQVVERGKFLEIRVNVRGEGVEVHRVRLEKGGLVAGGLSPLLALPRLHVGMRWTTVVFNPLTLSPQTVELEVLHRDRLRWSGEILDTHVVEIRSGFMKAQAWVARNGEVLKETTLFGLTLIRERVEEAPNPKSETRNPKETRNPESK
ncbi:MAG: hypothetical protein FJ291_11395 [Planctomycetes bacterium]|nr:hypothetical protein [Planctomycetota bacterium]